MVEGIDGSARAGSRNNEQILIGDDDDSGIIGDDDDDIDDDDDDIDDDDGGGSSDKEQVTSCGIWEVFMIVIRIVDVTRWLSVGICFSGARVGI